MDDGFAALSEDHRRCEELFVAVGAQTPPDPSIVSEMVAVLAIHDGLESECLYPLIEDRLEDGNAMARDHIAVHAEVARTLSEIERRPVGDARRQDLLAQVIDQTRRHIADEEETVFPSLRRHLAPEELSRLAQGLEAARNKVPTRPHPHLPRFGVGTRVSASTLRPLDRLRDRLRRSP